MNITIAVVQDNFPNIVHLSNVRFEHAHEAIEFMRHQFSEWIGVDHPDWEPCFTVRVIGDPVYRFAYRM